MSVGDVHSHLKMSIRKSQKQESLRAFSTKIRTLWPENRSFAILGLNISVRNDNGIGLVLVIGTTKGGVEIITEIQGTD